MTINKDLVSCLRTSGVLSAAHLRSKLGIGPNTLSRLTRAASEQIVTIGKGKSTQYALRRLIPDVGSSLPLREVLPDGTARELGTLHAIVVDPASESFGFYFQSQVAGIPSSTSRDLPHFLNDVRPAGFLGSLVPLRHPEMGFPRDVRDWTPSHTLRYLSRFGSNVPGNLIVGDEAFRAYLTQLRSPPTPVKSSDRAKRYSELAVEILRLGDPGSSAGGEQPKFLVTLASVAKHVLVKFSPPIATEVGRRVADLLVCEHLALETLRKAGVPASKSEILAAGDRIFLEVERFDRVGSGGRRGVVSLDTLDQEHSGARGTWVDSVTALIREKILPPSFLVSVRRLAVFGDLIANSDMHLCNLSFFAEDLRPTELTPVYDMTPWLFAPRRGEVIEVDFTPPLPSPLDGPVWEPAWIAALAFWRAASTDKRISSAFRQIAAAAGRAIGDLEAVARALPK